MEDLILNFENINLDKNPIIRLHEMKNLAEFMLTTNDFSECQKLELFNSFLIQKINFDPQSYPDYLQKTIYNCSIYLNKSFQGNNFNRTTNSLALYNEIINNFKCDF